jgi:hypothetical protein
VTSGSRNSNVNKEAGATPLDKKGVYACAAWSSGSRDGVYLLRPGAERRSSCRVRIKQHSNLQTRRKAIRLLVTVVITFALCVLPFHLREVLKHCLGQHAVEFENMPYKYIAQVCTGDQRGLCNL